MSKALVDAEQMGVTATLSLRVSDTADNGNDINTAVVVIRDVVRGALLSNGFNFQNVEEAIKHFGTVEI